MFMKVIKRWLTRFGYFWFLGALILCLGTSSWLLRRGVAAPAAQESALPAASEPSEATGLIHPLDPDRSFELSAQQTVVWSDALACWSGHTGWDLPCEEGAAVYALHGGRVARLYRDRFLGNTLLVTGEAGETLYAGLGEDTSLRKGDFLSAGDPVGRVGEPGLGELGAFHLHLEYRPAQ